MEPLESRVLLSGHLLTDMVDPSWQEAGPDVIIHDPAVTAIVPSVLVNPKSIGERHPGDQVAIGAIETVLFDSVTQDYAYVGTVGGGVWRAEAREFKDTTPDDKAINAAHGERRNPDKRTTQQDASKIQWEPIFEGQPSLHIGAMAMTKVPDPNAPNDPNRSIKTLYVGTGSHSNTSANRLPEMNQGVFWSRNTETSDPNNVIWTQIGPGLFNNQPIRASVSLPQFQTSLHHLMQKRASTSPTTVA